MKKLLSLLLAALLLFSCGAAALAAETRDVVIHTVGGGGVIYAVNVTWDALEFTYRFAGSGTWNAATHQYSVGTSADAVGWDKTTANIQVTNHSNAAVAILMELSAYITNNVTAAIDGGSFTLPTAEGTTPAGAPTSTATLRISGVPNVQNTTFVHSTVTVNIAPG